MRARRPLRSLHGVKPVNKERRAKLREIQYGPDDFVFWVHALSCIVPGCTNRDVEEAHVRSRAAGGSWRDVVPMCKSHHRRSHTAGILTFERETGLDLVACADAVQRRWKEYSGDV